MKKVNEYLVKKQLATTVKEVLRMNDCSVTYVKELLDKYDDTFTSEEKENLNNLVNYLDKQLNVFFVNLMPK